jgi:hypothetical protein
MNSLGVWSPLAVVLLIASRALIDKITASSLGANDLVLLLRRVDIQVLETLLAPEEEARLRSEMSTRAYRRIQRRRILGAYEQVRRISHNANVLWQWSNREAKKLSSKRRAKVDGIGQFLITTVECAAIVKSEAWWALAKLLFWRITLMQIWPFLPSPSLSDLREIFGRDLLQDYETLSSSVGQVLLATDIDFYEQVRAAL